MINISVALSSVFDLKFNGIHLAKIIFKVWLFMDNTSSMYLYMNRDANFFFPANSRDCINSAPYERLEEG